MTSPRSSRRRYRAFVDDYKRRRLDDENAAGAEGKNASPSGLAGLRHGKRREYLRDYLRWLRPHRRGIVSLARSNDPNSAGSQFFIVVKDSNFLDGQYTAFGEVGKGMDVADTIVHLPRKARDLPSERAELTVGVE